MMVICVKIYLSENLSHEKKEYVYQVQSLGHFGFEYLHIVVSAAAHNIFWVGPITGENLVGVT